MKKEKIIFSYSAAMTILLCFNSSNLYSQSTSEIFLRNMRDQAGIDFVHYAPRPRWCKIGPSVVGAATNEGLILVFDEEKEFWKSNDRLLTLDEFANIHLIKMNGSGGAWLDYDGDGD
ncbi:MAG: hypothetical protein DSY99_02505, partial [Candidatus Neomarinimicrobiota bacterium]